jgi:hypothetical protein
MLENQVFASVSIEVAAGDDLIVEVANVAGFKKFSGHHVQALPVVRCWR